MLGSKACFAADDVTIPCRIRHSEKATDRQFTDSQEMTCTMRVWHKTRDPGSFSVVRKVGVTKTQSFTRPGGNSKKTQQGVDDGPELILTPNDMNMPNIHNCCGGDFSSAIQMSDPFASFVSGPSGENAPLANQLRRRSITPVRYAGGDPLGGQLRRRSITPVRYRGQPPSGEKKRDVTIPVSDVLIVDMFGEGDCHQCNLTTMSNGYYEFTMENRNGQDILLAFLKANLPKDRVMDGKLKRTQSGVSNNSASTGNGSFDVEAFTATRMVEKLESETVTEKIRRKVGKVFMSFEELTAAMTDCSCGCTKDTVAPAPMDIKEKRDSPPRDKKNVFANFEMAPTATQDLSLEDDSILDVNASTKKDLLRRCHLPSGLSVESEEDLPGLEKEADI